MLRNNTKVAAVLLTGGLALGTYAGGITSAGATGPSTDVTTKASETYKSEAYGVCMDGHANNVDAHRCDGSSDQKWSVTHWGDGTVRLKNVGTGECLSDGGGTLGTSSNCSTSRYQSFYVDHWNDGTIRFRNQGTGQCVKVARDEWDVGSTTCDKSEAQSWY